MTTVMDRAFSYAELEANPDIIIRAAIETRWGFTRRHSALVATLNMIGNKGMFGGKNSIRGKKPYWAIGDYFNEVGATTANFAQGASSPSVTLDTNEYKSGDMVQLIDTSGATALWVTLRLTNNGDGSYGYTCTEYASNTSGHTFSSGTTFVKTAPAVNYDDQAREMNNIKGDLMYNYMQRSRDTSGIGLAESSEGFIADHSLEHNIRMAYDHFARKMNASLYFNYKAANATAGNPDYGVAGGLPYFFNPEGLSGTGYVANSSYVGQNKVVHSANISLGDLEDWMSKLTDYGDTTKVLFASKTMALKIAQAMRDSNFVGIRRTTIDSLDIGIPSLWEVQSFTTSFGEMQLVYDNGLTGKAIKVVDNIDGTHTAANTTDWAVAVDMTMTKLIYLDMEKEGVKTPQVRNIEAVRNDSNAEAEVDAFWTLAMKDPRAGGYIALDGGS